MTEPSKKKRQASPFCDCLYFSANSFARSMNALAEKEFGAIGLSPSHAFLLMAVSKNPGIHPSDLAQSLRLTVSTVTRLMEKLEDAGLLVRTAAGKSVEVRLTAKGNRKAPLAYQCWQRLYVRYVAILGEKQANNLVESINEASQILEN